MSIPILRYIDIVIGLAVVVLLVCTIVTAITQLLLASSFSRARTLRSGLADLIRQIDGRTLGAHAMYVAERCLRHPMVARDDAFLGIVTTPIRNFFRGKRDKGKL